MKELPLDMIFWEILPRLPARFLFCCKSVCKSWRALISNAGFINLHLRRSLSSDSDSNSFLSLTMYYGGLVFYHLDSGKAFKRRFDKRNVSIIGSCNGLVCVGIGSQYYTSEYKSDDFMLLLNPCIRLCKQVPLLKEPQWTEYDKVGFGFDSVSNDYKVVRVLQHFYDDDDDSDLGEEYEQDWLAGLKRREVRVYSLKADSWKQVELTHYPKDPAYLFPEDATVIQNYLVHWKFWSKSQGCIVVRCFNLRDERWADDDVPLPDDVFPLTEGELGVLNNCLCLSTGATLHRSGTSSGVDINVWVMKEYGVKESWTKLVAPFDSNLGSNLVVSDPCQGSRSETYFRISQLAQGSLLLSYNFRNRQTKTDPIPLDVYSSAVHICSGSLVPIAGATNKVPNSYP